MKRDIYDRFGGAPAVAERYVETARELGVADDGKGLDLCVPSAVEQKIRLLYEAEDVANREMIGLCPSAKHRTKIWIKERFAFVAAALARSRDLGVVLFGSQEERMRCEEIAGLIRMENAATPVLNMAGRLSLLETAACMDRCAIVLSNDSGLMHIAAARKRNVVAVFGSTVRQFGFFPFGTKSLVVESVGLDCRPCTHIGLRECPRGHFKCMNDISGEQVLHAAQRVMVE